MSITEDPARRVYRHVPWLIVLAVVAAMTTGCIAAVGAYVVRAPSGESVATALIVLVPLLAFLAFLVLSVRVRTVVDAAGVTQHWISSRHHMPYEEITELEPDHVYSRWFLRVRCGDRTYETIPATRSSGPSYPTSSARPGPCAPKPTLSTDSANAPAADGSAQVRRCDRPG